MDLEFDYPETIAAIDAALSTAHTVKKVECTCELEHWIAELRQFSPDIALNVAEGYFGSAREAFFPNLLEQMQIKYVGSDTTVMLFGQNKALCKSLANSMGMNTPRWGLINDPSDIVDLQTRLKFPLFVKPNSEGSSLGIDAGSIVKNASELAQRAAFVLTHYKCPALVEEFIDGIDLSVSFVEGLGTLMFGPIAYDIGDSTIYDYEWKKRSFKYPSIVVPYNLLPPLANRMLLASCLSFVEALGVRGYARADYRLSKDGVAYFLEINTQVEMAPNAEFAAPIIDAGYSFRDILLHLITHAGRKSERISSSPLFRHVNPSAPQ